jgi:hypothetical protein
MASVAPRSIPAGLSQITQSNFARKLLDDVRNALLSQCILVAGLRGRQQPQRLEPLVPDEGLRESRHALNDVDEVEDHAALGPITRSRLRRPTSKSMTATFSPACASAAPSAAKRAGLDVKHDA